MTRVLILDDDATILSILGRQFQALGADVVTCREIEAAEAVLDVLPVDKLLTDLCVSTLGGLEGTRLLRHIAAQAPGVEIFAMSGHLDEKIRDLVNALGVVEAFSKPFDPLRLARRVLGAVGDGGTRRGDLQVVEPLGAHLASDRLHALLQPVVALRHASAPYPLHGYEGYASAAPDCPLRNPMLLFGLAARKDRLLQTDLLCVRATLAEAGLLGRSFRLFIKAHPRSLEHPDFGAGFLDEVERAGVSPANVVLQLSERQAALDAASLTAPLAVLRRAGFQVSLDNYGEGSSNLKAVLDLKPDYVKFSGSLAQGIDVDRVRRDVLGSTREMLGRLGIRSILSRIETPSELAAALDLGFDFGQGWQFSRPLRAAALQDAAQASGPAHGAGARGMASPFALPRA